MLSITMESRLPERIIGRIEEAVNPDSATLSTAPAAGWDGPKRQPTILLNHFRKSARAK